VSPTDLSPHSSLLFCGTSYLSLKTALHFRRSGTLPATNDPTFALPTKTQPRPTEDADFDADFDAEDDLGNPNPQSQPPRRTGREDDEYALLHQSEERLDEVQPHPGRPVSYGRPDRQDVSPYGGYNTGSYSNDGNAHMNADTSYGGPYGQRNGSQGGGDPFRSDLELSHEQGGYGINGREGYGGVAPPPRYER
jgi:hypothetical protein